LKLKLSPRLVILLDFLLLFLMTAGLIRPFFRAGYTTQWGSIESSFIADARFLIAHWPHPQWQPLWYAGTRFDYVYPPALRYGTAVISMLTGAWPVKAYHFYISFFYCLGIAGVYLLVRIAAKSRGMAWVAAMATAVMSPSFLFLAAIRKDSWMLLPLRLGVLTKYGEGPHMTALALIPFALVFAWLAFESYRPIAMALSALFFAAVVSNNFYGAIALLVFYPILVWSFWITRKDKRIRIPAIVIPVLTYGLTACWLVPSYFKVTAENLKYVSEHGTTWSIWLAVAIAVIFAIATDRLAANQPERTWAVFTTGAVIFFALNVLGNYYFKFRISGEPLRLAPELDLTMILAAATVLHWMWNRPRPGLRWTAGIFALLSFCTAGGYLRHAWQMFPLSPYQDRVEYKISEWFWKNMPDARLMPAGSVRFWFDAWHDLTQLGGGSDQGILNGVTEQSQWEIQLGPKPEPAILWMQCLGVDATYVSTKESQEMFKDTEHPEKYDGVLPVLFDDHQGNRIFRIPRRYPARVRIVETQRLNALKRPRANDDVEYLQAYADVVERGPDAPGTLERPGTDAMHIKVTLAPGQTVVVQESYDPAWHAWAWQDGIGKPLPVRKDAMGFIAIDVQPWVHEITLAFITPLENQVGRILTGISILAILALLAHDTYLQMHS
jgi:hypothetical protein